MPFRHAGHMPHTGKLKFDVVQARKLPKEGNRCSPSLDARTNEGNRCSPSLDARTNEGNRCSPSLDATTNDPIRHQQLGCITPTTS